MFVMINSGKIRRLLLQEPDDAFLFQKKKKNTTEKSTKVPSLYQAVIANSIKIEMKI